MYILDYLQFLSQKTLGAPRPQSHLHEFTDSWLVPNVICTVADVGWDLLHTLVVQHGLLFRESAGKLLVDSSARKKTPAFTAALF